MVMRDLAVLDSLSDYAYVRTYVCLKDSRTCVTQDNYVIVVEHDLAVLDYLSDYTTHTYVRTYVSKTHARVWCRTTT